MQRKVLAKELTPSRGWGGIVGGREDVAKAVPHGGKPGLAASDAVR